MKTIVVDRNGRGDYRSVQEAVNAAPDHSQERTVIHIKNSFYFEKLTVPVSKTNLCFIGESRDGVVIAYDDVAGRLDDNGEKLGTYRTPSTTILANDFYAENLTFANNAGLGTDAGQAVAIQVDGDRAVFRNVRFTGRQDTLFTTGSGRQYYADCLIEGTVDFIFGPATCVFENCEVFSLDRHNGYVTAASTSAEQPYGYVFLNCRLTTNGQDEKVYLGRPWQPHSSVAYIGCWMDKHIRAVGWDNWRDPAKEQTARYAEYANTGPGADTAGRVSWVKQLTAEEAAQYTAQAVLGGADQWKPAEVRVQLPEE